MQEQPAKVLTTPELLEIILLHLDIRTLLVSAQRVCRTWTALIQSSPALQQALFFQQTARRPSLNENRKPDQGYPPRIYNPLLVKAFPPFFPSDHEYPPIHDNETESNHERREEKETESPYFSFKPLDMFSSPQKKTAYLRKEASWRKMLLCQPPVNGGLAVFKMHHASGGDSYDYYPVPQHQEKQVDNDNHDDILKMNHLFTTLTRDRNVYFGRFGETRVYWSAYVPPCKPHVPGSRPSSYPPSGGSFDPTVKKGFAKAIEESEVVVYSREVFQCVVELDRELTDEERLQREIVEAEDEEVKEEK